MSRTWRMRDSDKKASRPYQFSTKSFPTHLTQFSTMMSHHTLANTINANPDPMFRKRGTTSNLPPEYIDTGWIVWFVQPLHSLLSLIIFSSVTALSWVFVCSFFFLFLIFYFLQFIIIMFNSTGKPYRCRPARAQRLTAKALFDDLFIYLGPW